MEILSSRVLLRPRDFDRSRQFYGETLGLHVYREYRGGVVFFLGGGFLELSGHGGPERADGKVALWLQVRDVDAEQDRLASAGVEVIETAEDMPWGLRELRVSDPDGVILVLVEVPPDHPLRRDTRG